MSLKVQEDLSKGSEAKTKETPQVQSQEPTMKEALELIQRLKAELDKKNEVNNSNSELIAALKTLIPARQESVNEIKYRSFRDSADIDPNDVLEKPVTFYAYTSFYCIADDLVQGRSVLAPLGPINFEHVSTSRNGNGRDTSLVLVSRFICKSKKEYEFLKKHSMFNVMFFERSDINESVDIRFAQKISKINNMLANRPVYDVLQMARENGIQISGDDMDRQDGQKIKMQVATVLAQREIANEQVVNVRSVDDIADELFFGKK
jgi:hypothetical protein